MNYELLFGLLSIIFSFIAYFKRDRLSFLKFNAFAIFFIAISFFLQKAYNGGFSELLMLIVHIVAIFTNENIRKKAILFVPPISFIIFIIILYFDNEVEYFSLLVPLAMSLFTYGAFVEDMKRNKIVFILGLFFLSIYSFFTGTYFILFANLIGIIILTKVYFNIKN